MEPIESRLSSQAAQENCDGEPWDTMQEAADEIAILRARVAELEAKVHRQDNAINYITDEAERYMEALERIWAEDSCNTLYEDKTCRYHHPTTHSEWCSHCIASDALNP